MIEQRPVILNQSEIGWEAWEDQVIAGEAPVRWKILISGERGPSSQLVTGIAEMLPNALIPLHHHEPEEMYYVISGSGYLTLEDREAYLCSGASVFIPSNAKHSLLCTGNDKLIFLFAFAADRFDEIIYHFDRLHSKERPYLSPAQDCII